MYAKYGNKKDLIEGLTSNNLNTSNGEPRCPNLLLQKGSKFLLYNTKLAEVPGVNPIEFNNLEDYTEFLEWQKGAGIRCPVLYVQQGYDAQGNKSYQVRPSVSEPQGGLPPAPPVSVPMKPVSAENVDVNKQDYPAFNQSSYLTSTSSPAELVKNSEHNMLYSDNAMDANWGGAEYTQSLVDAGYYKGNEVEIAIP